MSNTIVMPTYARPEMLALSLEQIQKQIPDNTEIYICLDTSSAERLEEIEYIRDEYSPEAYILHAPTHVQVPSGMWNILNALKEGFNTNSDYVFLIEEDILILPGYFDYHFEFQPQSQLATCGRKSPR